MKLSVSLSDKDIEFLDFYVTTHDLESRSAALQAALRALRDVELEDSYVSAFQEHEEPEVLAKWDQMWEAGQAARDQREQDWERLRAAR